MTHGTGCDLLVVGDANPDVVLAGAPRELAYGQVEQLVGGGALTVGGSAAILACGAARLGLTTALASVVGGDAAGRFMLEELARRGVDVDGAVVAADLATGLTVSLTRGDDRTILTFPGCIDEIDTALIEGRRVSAARHLHVSSFFLQPRLAAGLPRLFHEARAAGAGTSLDLNWDPTERWGGGLPAVLPLTDVLFVNRAEALAISGAPTVEDAAVVLADRGPLPVVKCGADGALALDDDRIVLASAPAVDVVDTVGAGDSFDAGFLAGRLTGLDLRASLELACACGSLSTRSSGGVDAQPTIDEALAALR